MSSSSLEYDWIDWTWFKTFYFQLASKNRIHHREWSVEHIKVGICSHFSWLKSFKWLTSTNWSLADIRSNKDFLVQI